MMKVNWLKQMEVNVTAIMQLNPLTLSVIYKWTKGNNKLKTTCKLLLSGYGKIAS